MGTFKKLETRGVGPSERSTPGAATIDQYVYIFGGVKDDFNKKTNTIFDDLYRLDTQTNTWESLEPIGDKPPARSFAGILGDSKRKQIFLFGGANYSADFSKMTMFNDLWVYSQNNNTWSQLTQEIKPSPRSKPKLWLFKDKIYLFSGVTPHWQTLNDLWVYDLLNNTWSEIATTGNLNGLLPPPRLEALGGMTSTSEGKLIFYGGESIAIEKNGLKFGTLNDVWSFDMKSNRWSEITPKNNNIMPPRNFASAVSIGDYMYLQGGACEGVGKVPKEDCGAPFPQRCITDEMWRFHLISHTWEKLNPGGSALPRLKRTSATVVGDKMYIFSGWDFQWYGNGPGQIWNTDTYFFDPN